MKYSITFYCYKLEENELSISISKKNNEYILIKTYSTMPLDASFEEYTEETSFRHYIPMLHYLMDKFTEFYKDHTTYTSYNIDKLPPTYYITNICNLEINTYIAMTKSAKLQMENAICVYSTIIEDIRSKLNKTAFRLLTIKIEKENIKCLQTLCIVADLIVDFL